MCLLCLCVSVCIEMCAQGKMDCSRLTIPLSLALGASAGPGVGPVPPETEPLDRRLSELWTYKHTHKYT